MMQSPFKSVVEVLLTERDWSWSVIGILYLLAAFFVRSGFVGPLAAQLKKIDRSLHHEVKNEYLLRSLWGWIFFMLPLGVIVFFWRQNALGGKINPWVPIAASLASFIFSILLHLAAFASAALSTLKRLSESRNEKYSA